MDVIKEFLEAAESGNLTLSLTQNAVSKWREDLAKVFNEASTQEAKTEFYNTYIDFARKCEELGQLGGVSGYGGIKDYEKLRIKDYCRAVDYNFPYGWKSR